MKIQKNLRNISETIIEKDTVRTKEIEEAEQVLKVAAHMGPYAFRIIHFATHTSYSVQYELVPEEIKIIISTAMELVHKELESQYKQAVLRQKGIKNQLRDKPNDRWIIEQFNSVTRSLNFLELTVPSLKEKE